VYPMQIVAQAAKLRVCKRRRRPVFVGLKSPGSSIPGQQDGRVAGSEGDCLDASVELKCPQVCEDSIIISLRQLRYFVRIVETGSMTKAAEHFRVAQTALGLQVRELERYIGGKILERHSRGVMPTPSGQLLFERAREILDLVDRTVVEVTQLQRKTAEVITFGFIPSQMQLLAHDLLLWARRELPTVLLRLIEEFRPHEAIRRGEVDFGIGCQVPEQPGLVRASRARSGYPPPLPHVADADTGRAGH